MAPGRHAPGPFHASAGPTSAPGSWPGFLNANEIYLDNNSLCPVGERNRGDSRSGDVPAKETLMVTQRLVRSLTGPARIIRESLEQRSEDPGWTPSSKEGHSAP